MAICQSRSAKHYPPFGWSLRQETLGATRAFARHDHNRNQDQAWYHSAQARRRLAVSWRGHSVILALLAVHARATFLIVRAIVMRALQEKNFRHAILRFRANAARASIALGTLPQVVQLCFPGMPLKEHRQDGYFALPNGSRIWIGGLDDKDRVEKILGLE